MYIKAIGQFAGAIMLATGLAACVDVTLDVEVQSETRAKATTIMTVGSDFYSMVKAGMAAGQAEAGVNNGFCDETGAVLTENADGSATCTTTTEGAFSDIKPLDSDNGIAFEVVGPGLVRASFSTAAVASKIAENGAAEEVDAQTQAMITAFFEDRNLTIRVAGKQVVDTNMTVAGDRKSAQTVIPFIDLLNGSAELPDEYYATIKTN